MRRSKNYSITSSAVGPASRDFETCSRVVTVHAAKHLIDHPLADE
jgi:hypothetical protein